jgi:hypothetical protein
MGTDDRLDESITSWLEQTAPARLPDRVLAATFERTRTSRQQVGWRAGLGRIHVARSVAALGGAAAVVTVATVLALGSFVGVAGPSPSSEIRSVFAGTWYSISDADGGTQTMTVQVLAEDVVEIVVTDDIASVCSRTPSTMTGTGRLEGDDRLVIPAPVYTCDDGSEAVAMSGPPLQDQLRNLTYVHDIRTDVLTVGPGSVWTRQVGLVPSIAPIATSTASPTPGPSLDPADIIAKGTLVDFAETVSGTVLTTWETCENQFDPDCGHAWRIGTGSSPRATGLVGRGDVHVEVSAVGDGFVLGPARGRERASYIAPDGTLTWLSTDCSDAALSSPTAPGRPGRTAGPDFLVDTVAGTICPVGELGDRPLAMVTAADGLLWALVDNDTAGGPLTVGRFDGDQWRDHQLPTNGGARTSLLAAAGPNVVVLQAPPEPVAQGLIGLSVSTDAGATWSDIVDQDVLSRDAPFSANRYHQADEWYSSHTSMAFAGSSVLYVADGNGDLWRSTDFTSFDPVEVPGRVSDLKPAGDALIARLIGSDDLVRIAADGAVTMIAVR